MTGLALVSIDNSAVSFCSTFFCHFQFDIRSSYPLRISHFSFTHFLSVRTKIVTLLFLCAFIFVFDVPSTTDAPFHNCFSFRARDLYSFIRQKREKKWIRCSPNQLDFGCIEKLQFYAMGSVCVCVCNCACCECFHCLLHISPYFTNHIQSNTHRETYSQFSIQTIVSFFFYFHHSHLPSLHCSYVPQSGSQFTFWFYWKVLFVCVLVEIIINVFSLTINQFISMLVVHTYYLCVLSAFSSADALQYKQHTMYEGAILRGAFYSVCDTYVNVHLMSIIDSRAQPNWICRKPI